MRLYRLICLIVLGCIAAEPAFAYVGPGAGLTFLGSLFAVVGAIIAGIFGFIWFPIKRLLRARRRTKQDTGSIDDD